MEDISSIIDDLGVLPDLANIGDARARGNGLHMHSEGWEWCSETETSNRILFFKDNADLLRLVIQGMQPTDIKWLGDASERVVSDEFTQDDEVTRIMRIECPIKSQWDRVSFANLCLRLIHLSEQDPNASTPKICKEVRSYLENKIDPSLPDINKRIGLTSELWLLKLLLELSSREDNELNQESALDCWQGYSNEYEETRDFGSESGVIIEVKATKDPQERVHMISNWEQLFHVEGEDLYILSCSLRPMKTGQHHFLDLAKEIEEILEDDALVESFRTKMETQGFPHHQWVHYEGDTKYRDGAFPIALVRISQDVPILDRESFAEGRGPYDENSVIRRPQYSIDLQSLEQFNHDTDDFDSILLRMMGHDTGN
mgnify:CR=1 FL=1